MPHYDVEVVISFSGTVCASSRDEAEQFAMTNWDQASGAQISYDGVESCRATETEDREYTDNCEDECPSAEDEDEEEEEE